MCTSSCVHAHVHVHVHVHAHVHPHVHLACALHVYAQVEAFLSTPSEALLATGLPLKLGLLLHGPPGTSRRA